MRPTLVIHPGALGDVLLTIPALRALKSLAPAAPLVLAAQPSIGALLTALAVVDGHLPFDTLGLAPLFVENGAAPHVPAVERAARVVCWFGAGDSVFAGRLRRLAPDAVVASARGDERRPVWTHLLASVGAPEGDWSTPVVLPPALLTEGGEALRQAGWDGAAPLVMAHPGAGGQAKRWPVEGFAAVLEGIIATRRARVVLSCGPADAEAVGALGARLDSALVLREAPLPRLAGALRHVTAYVGNDSGVSHLAAAVGTPALVLFATANVAWRPWGASARVQLVQAGAPDDVVAVRAGLAALLG